MGYTGTNAQSYDLLFNVIFTTPSVRASTISPSFG